MLALDGPDLRDFQNAVHGPEAVVLNPIGGVVRKPLPINEITKLVGAGRQLGSCDPSAVFIVHRPIVTTPTIEISDDENVVGVWAEKPKFNGAVSGDAGHVRLP